MELISALQAFVRAAERLSFSAAARDLAVSQPHITRAIAQLEDRLGARLFLRSTRQLTLTDEGLDYLGHARQILAGIDEADRSVGRRAGTLSGRLRVFAPVSLGRAWVLPRLASFMERYPQLDVYLILDDRPRDLIEERIDVGIRVGPLDDSTYRVRPLGDVGYQIVAAPSFWQRHGRPQDPDALAQLPAVIFDGTIRADRFTVVNGAQRAELVLSGRLATNSSEGILAALDNALGFCVVPDWLAAEPLARGTLERGLAGWVPERRLALLAIYPATRAATERVRRFIDWLVFALAADGLVRVDGGARSTNADVDH